MKWTQEKPTSVGFYWHRIVGSGQFGRVVRIDWSAGGFTPSDADDYLCVTDIDSALEDMHDSEWSDVPIVPPDDSDSGHCTRCGESNMVMRNGRCQNVPASEHVWSR